MKKAKFKKICNLVLIVCMLMQGMICPMPAGAADPALPERTVSVSLYHEHGNRNSGCYEDVFYPCGGEVVFVRDDGTGQIFQCQKCMQEWHGEHPDIHEGNTVRERTCKEDYLGDLYIDRRQEGKRVSLAAGVLIVSEIVGDLTLSWDRAGSYGSGDEQILPLSGRGTYTATLRYHDKNLDEWIEKKISYTEQTTVHVVKFMDGEDLLFEMEVEYGDRLKRVDPPVKTGYDFLGFYRYDDQYYDPDGMPVGRGAEVLDDSELILMAKWEAHRYTIHYGTDSDGDGSPDESMQVTYDEPYPDVEVPELAEDMVFDGYYLGEDMVFDENGISMGIWRWDAEEPVLELKSHEKEPAGTPPGRRSNGALRRTPASPRGRPGSM